MTNNSDDSLPYDENDPEVSAQYRALADETTPNKLDIIVLRAASEAARSDSATDWGATWYRPVTFVATLGLCLAVLLEINEFQLFDPPPDLGTQAAAPPEANAFQDAADSAAISVRAVDATADESLQLSNPEVSNTAAISIPALPTSAATAVRHCSDEQMALPEKWWQCIQELRHAGHGAAAELELEHLQKSFPQYVPAK